MLKALTNSSIQRKERITRLTRGILTVLSAFFFSVSLFLKILLLSFKWSPISNENIVFFSGRWVEYSNVVNFIQIGNLQIETLGFFLVSFAIMLIFSAKFSNFTSYVVLASSSVVLSLLLLLDLGNVGPGLLVALLRIIGLGWLADNLTYFGVVAAVCFCLVGLSTIRLLILRGFSLMNAIFFTLTIIIPSVVIPFEFGLYLVGGRYVMNLYATTFLEEVGLPFITNMVIFLVSVFLLVLGIVYSVFYGYRRNSEKLVG